MYFYIVLWSLVLVISTYLFYKASGTLSLYRPNLISITYYYSFLVSSFIGALLIVLGIDNFYVIDRLYNQENRIIGFYVICAVMLLFPLVSTVVSRLVGFDAKAEFNNYFNAPVKLYKDIKKEFYPWFLVLSVICLMSVVYTFLMLDRIPIIEMLRGSEDLAQLRIDASREFSGNVFIRNIFALTLTPLLSVVAYVYLVVTRELKWRILFVFLFIGSILIETYALAKAPVIFYLAMLLLVRIYIGRTILNFRKVLVIGTSGAIILVLMYIFVGNVTNLSTYLSYNSGPIGRIILSQISAFYIHLDLFGNTFDYLYGRSFPSSIINLFDMDHIRSARLVLEETFPNRIEQGTGGVMNTLFIAEAYANFGYMGIFLGTIYVAFVIQSIYIIFLRLPKHPVYLSLFVFFTMNLPQITVGGFVDFIYNPLYMMVSTILLLCLIIPRYKKAFRVY